MNKTLRKKGEGKRLNGEKSERGGTSNQADRKTLGKTERRREKERKEEAMKE